MTTTPDDVAEQISRRKRRVQVGRVDIARDRGEEIDVVSSDDADQGGGIAHVQLIKGAILEN